MDSLPDLIKESAEPLPNIDDPEFATKFDKFATADIILIGDGSHGTSEFYRARAAITQRLIEKHGFRIVAVEADWPDCRQIDRYVCGQRLKGGRHPLDGFTRFPLWMWRNEEVASFIKWLKKHNANVDEEGQAHFYGLDLYSMGSSIRAVIDYLDSADPETAKIARERYGCLLPWVEDPSRYGRASLTAGYALCEKKVVSMLVDLLRKRGDLAKDDGDSFFDGTILATKLRTL
ncbi:erythromycin esterase domain-containing protein [Ditylenchus destructor]|nr:erythromycin esterase domain-containing protein [Ditylenchus destructor]